MPVGDPRGSVWRRWEPHIHTPGTVLNDQFKGADPWDVYLTEIEQSDPPIEVLAVTDYWTLGSYQKVLSYIASGRLPAVKMVFPNVEMRYGIATDRGSPINVHLLISPDEPDHVEQAERFLRSLSFSFRDEIYRCAPEDLRRLGRAHDPTATEDVTALQKGAEQFKIMPEDLRRALRDSAWARGNILVGVAAKTGDGTAGIGSDSSFTSLRTEIERISAVVFSSRPGDREYWLGRGAATRDQLEARVGGRKLCLHGSDAHSADRVGRVSQDRFTWIKGDPSFEALRQACIEPDSRGAIGRAAPTGPPPHRVIDSIETENSGWNQNPRLILNAGLVAIVGARGSGKTALADVLAFAGQSDEPVDNERSFLRRAHRHIIGETYRLNWQEGDSTARSYGDDYESAGGAERVQYLSQQFVERLCSSEGVTDDLLEEIERVVFDSGDIESRQGASSFKELLEMKTARGREVRAQCEEEIVSIGQKVNEERSKQAALTSLGSQRDAVTTTLRQDRSARDALIAEGKQGDRERLQVVAAAVEERQRKLELAERDRRTVVALQSYVTDFRDRIAPNELANLRHDNDRAGFAEAEWSRFLKMFSGDVDDLLAMRLAEKDEVLRVLKGAEVAERDATEEPYVPVDADLEGVSLSALRLESDRLRKLIGLDAVKTDRLKQLNGTITQSEAQLARLNEQIADSERAQARIVELNERRKSEYARIFSAIEDEARELEKLYEPLRGLLEQEEGALGRLEFSVRRVVDIEEWAQRGERLLDLRTFGPFRGHGALLRAARDELLDAWTAGSSDEVADAMASFRSNYDHALLEHAPVPKAKRAEYWAWGGRIAEWLTSTGHISVQYGIRYGGVEVEELSPGTRGIVLLLLYLSLDRQDDRPLIIDQPEENLDPKSIFDELVPRFKSTRQRRQVIMVTHNANLVVNTDADQIIVASASSHGAGQLPELSYSGGGLEDAVIRGEVCAVLEGGESAFKERAARLRVQLDERPANSANK